jgi:hypothetical protein
MLGKAGLRLDRMAERMAEIEQRRVPEVSRSSAATMAAFARTLVSIA